MSEQESLTKEKLYIADKKVKGLAIIEKTTPLGARMYEIEFIDGSKEVMPEGRYNTIVTHSASDASKVMEKLSKKVAGTIYGMMHEYGVKFGEIDHIITQVVTLVNNGSDKATNLLWNVGHIDERTLIEINDVLTKYSDNGASSNGSGSDK